MHPIGSGYWLYQAQIPSWSFEKASGGRRIEHNLVIPPEYLYQPPNKGCQPVLALWGFWGLFVLSLQPSILIMSAFPLLFPSLFEGLSAVGALKRRWWLRIVGLSHRLFNLKLSILKEPNFWLGMNKKVTLREALVYFSDDGGRLPNPISL